MTVLRRTLLGSMAAMPLVGSAFAAAPLATAQAPSFFRYRVGDMQVTAIHDGMAYRPLDGFVPNAPPGELQKAMAEAFMPADRFPVSFTTLVINTGSKLVMIDAGNGNMGAPSSGKWMANFRAAGFTPDQVDLIIFSHFHGDHINGFRLKDGTAVFPKAEIMVPEAEWAFWTSDNEMTRASAGLKPNFENVRRVFSPVAKDVTPYAWGKELVPGITALRAEDHTPGHTAFAIASGTSKLLVMSDVTNHTSIFARHPDWSAVFDQDADTARATRRRMLDMAAVEKMQVCFYHAPFPATGFMVREGDGYSLVPVMWTAQT